MPDQFDYSAGLSICPLPHSDCFRSKSRPKLLLIQRRELTNRMNPPFVQDCQNLADLALPSFCCRIRRIRALHALKLSRPAYMFKRTLKQKPSDDFYWTLRQRLQEGPAIRPGQNATVE